MTYSIYYLFIYFIFADTFLLQNLPAYKCILLKDYFKYENKNKIIVTERFFMQVQSHQQGKCFTKTGNTAKTYSKMISS